MLSRRQCPFDACYVLEQIGEFLVKFILSSTETFSDYKTQVLVMLLL